MSILINGMKMPQRCKACRFCGFGGRRSELNVCMFTGESQPKLSQKRMSKCPLVPLPAGHGRLIDADALLAKDDGYYTQFGYYPDDIREAPTIVPAEGGGEDDQTDQN